MSGRSPPVRRRALLAVLGATAGSGCLDAASLLESESGPSLSWDRDCLAPGSPLPDGWLCRRGRPDGTGSIPAGPGSVPSERQWRRSIDASGCLTRVGSTLFAGTDDGAVALDAASGETDWRNDSLGAPARSLSTNGESVYVVTDEPGDGRVVALDAGTGETRWTESPYQSSSQLLPLGDGVVAVGDSSAIVAGLSDDGAECLSYERGADSLPAGAVGESRLYLSTTVHGGDSPSHSSVAALAPDGTIAWRTELELGGQGGLAVRDGLVYVLDGIRIVALSAADGSVEWGAPHGYDQHEWDATPAVSDERAFVHLGGTITAYDSATGDEQWTRDDAVSGNGAPLAVGDAVYVVDSPRGRIRAFDVGSGDEIETRAVDVDAVAFDTEAMYVAGLASVSRFS